MGLIAIIWIVIGIGLTESLLKPFAVAIVDGLLLPNLSAVYERVNPNAPRWLTDPGINGAVVGKKLAEILTDEIEGFAKRPKFIQDWSVRRLLQKYDLAKNADVIARKFHRDSQKKYVTNTPMKLVGKGGPSMSASVAEDIADELDEPIAQMLPELSADELKEKLIAIAKGDIYEYEGLVKELNKPKEQEETAEKLYNAIFEEPAAEVAALKGEKEIPPINSAPMFFPPSDSAAVFFPLFEGDFIDYVD